ncbi:LOW QUALITY PROTEIN: hypothetical protein TorRG33x02_029250 [Trema orientale]|uniref:Uncharacterized protein n=1 Tax=Trema orientale TaxID=63057 RepID=A0A2P5FTQ4_TREOI|nr:LOW QUALITY PROTEIN: hypothetical protein TorRG33x02_029250 [Trema orientale]
MWMWKQDSLVGPSLSGQRPFTCHAGPLPYNLLCLPKTNSIHSFHAKQAARASQLKSRFTSESHLSHYSIDATHAPFPT